MLNVLNCLTTDHSPPYVGAAVLICIIGSYLTMRLLARSLRSSTAAEKLVWICLSGIVGGGAIWTTHFLAMLGYLPGEGAGYTPGLTLLSLLIAVASCAVGLGIAAFSQRSVLAEGGGAVLGLGIAAMHYTGMAAFQVPGYVVWNETYVLASVGLGVLFGALATNRIIRPLTRFCRYGGTAAFALAIITTHFTGMAALQLFLEPGIGLSSSAAAPALLGPSVLGVMLVLMAVSACTYLLDAQTNRAAVARYRHLSLHDPLTGLPNRAAFQQEQRSVEQQNFAIGAKVGVFSFDLNRFKEINDVHGHAAGDHVLRALGARLKAALGAQEFLARIGGDEFVAFTQNHFSRADGVAFAKRLLAEIRKPIEWNENCFVLSSSVGIAVFDGVDAELESVIAQADVAMYRAKATGPDAICYYDASMDAAAKERSALAMDLRSACTNGELEVFYQAQHDTISGDLMGFEALVRWNHPTRGRVSPGDFIPIAEQNGMIGEIGEWVLRRACCDAASWRQPLGVAVNVAAQQLSDPDFPSRVRNVLLETGLAPAQLELEITESGLIAEQGRALVAIRQLKEIGVRIAMDDYGTGYSSLSTLMSFPFDKIKIDRSFIDRVHADRLSAAIVRSTLILAHSLNIPVLAEGVETAEQVDFLRLEGCEQVQGYYFGRPASLSEISPLVHAGGAVTSLSNVA